MTRALYGIDVRQPIGGDFGLCPELAAFYVKQDVWDTDVAHFGIDIWMTTCAVNEGHTIVQTYLGTKIHGAKDPASDLGPMFRQVVSTVFYLMSKYEHNWHRENPFRAIQIKNKIEEEPKLEAISVSMNDLHEEFVEGFQQFRPMYDDILNDDNLDRLDAYTIAGIPTRKPNSMPCSGVKYFTISLISTSSGSETREGLSIS